MKFKTIVFLFFLNSLTAQQRFGLNYTHSYTEQSIAISYGESLKGRFLSNDLHVFDWKIYKPHSKQVLKKGKGLQLLSYLFGNPGVYSIHFTSSLLSTNHNKNCVHYDVPNVLKVNVKENRIYYNFDKISIQPTIKGDQELNETVIKVQVIASHYYNNAIVFPKEILSSGVMCNIEGELYNTRFVEDNLYELSYKLRGKAAKSTFISLLFPNFKDNYETYSIWVE